MEASAKIILETKRKNTEGKYAVKLRITYNRKRKYYSILPFLKNDDWNFCSPTVKVKQKGKLFELTELEVIMQSTRGTNKDVKLNYEAIEARAKEVISNIPIFSFPAFESLFLNKKSNWNYLANAFEEYIADLKNEDRIGYAGSFKSTLTGIKYFCEGRDMPKGVQSIHHAHFKKYKNIKFIDITPQWLKKYEQYLRKLGKSTSTIGIHARNLRVLFNKALDDHGVKAEYPFKKYKPKTSTSNKRALTIEQINAIASYNAIDGSV